MFMHGGGDMDDMMNAFFGGGGGRRRQRKGRNQGHALPVTLEDLYNGKTVTLPREKTILCPTCKGRGSTKPGVGGTCPGCQGRGMKMQVRQLGPGMMQQMMVPCDTCHGQGSKIDDKDKCKACQGTKTKNTEAPLKVIIEKGMSHNTQIPFRGEGDQDPEIDIPGDVVIVLQQIKHDTFVRDEDDLHMKHELTLAEALCGFQFVITHLDGKQLVVQSEKGQIIKPETKMCLPKQGMPIYKSPGQFGDLVIEFVIKFPQRMEQGEMDLIRSALPPPAKTEVHYDKEEAQTCYVERHELEEIRKEIERQEDDVDEDEGGHGPGIQCAHQ